MKQNISSSIGQSRHITRTARVQSLKPWPCWAIDYRLLFLHVLRPSFALTGRGYIRSTNIFTIMSTLYAQSCSYNRIWINGHKEPFRVYCTHISPIESTFWAFWLSFFRLRRSFWHLEPPSLFWCICPFCFIFSFDRAHILERVREATTFMTLSECFWVSGTCL